MYVSSIRGGSLFCRSNLLGYLRYWTRKGIQRVIGTFNLIYESLEFFLFSFIVIYWPGGNRREERKGWSMLAKIAGRLGVQFFHPKKNNLERRIDRKFLSILFSFSSSLSFVSIQLCNAKRFSESAAMTLDTQSSPRGWGMRNHRYQHASITIIPLVETRQRVE